MTTSVYFLLCGHLKKITTTDRSAKNQKDCIQILNVKNVWLDKHKNSNSFTWCDESDTSKSRIYFLFTNNDLLNQFKNKI